MSKQSGCGRPLRPATLCDTTRCNYRHLEGGNNTGNTLNMSLLDPVCRTFAQCVVRNTQLINSFDSEAGKSAHSAGKSVLGYLCTPRSRYHKCVASRSFRTQ